MYDETREPSKAGLGSLIDDLTDLRRATIDPDFLGGFAFQWLASLLAAISKNYFR
jgi:hypothetical protein